VVVVLGCGVERDAEAEFDLPAVHADLLDGQAQQSLTLVEVERVDPVGGLLGEVGDPLAQAVADGELVSLGGQFGLLGLKLPAAGVDLGCPAVELFHVDVAGLVEVGDPAAFGGGFLDAAGEARELGVEDFVVRRGLAGDERLLAGEQHVGAQQDLAHLVEHERVELGGADHPFGAALVGSAGLDRVVVGAAVVAVLPGALSLPAACRPSRRIGRRRSAHAGATFPGWCGAD